MCVSTTTPALRGQKTSIAAAGLIGIGLTMTLQQVVGVDGPGLFFVALGAGFFIAYMHQPRPSDLIVPAGILTGLGLGTFLASDFLSPKYLHGALIFGMLALGFGGIYLLGEMRHRWALWPAAVLGVLGWLQFVTSAPWLKLPFGAAMNVLWPLAVAGVGLWLIDRARRRDLQQQ
jgi:hypothetical protein